MLYFGPVAEVAELADAPALGAGGRKAVGVRVPSSAPAFSAGNVVPREPATANDPGDSGVGRVRNVAG